MYFVDEEHETNYFTLMGKKGMIPGQNSEYEASLYISAHPEIYKCFDWDKYKMESTPLSSLLLYSNEDEDEVGFSPAPLTGSTWQLVKVGQSLYNGYKVDLSDFPLYNREMLNVLVQACKIRGRI